MIKWIVVYWITTTGFYTILVQRYDSTCNCWVDVPPPVMTRTDTTRVEFKKKGQALSFMKNNCADFTGCRLDSTKIK